MALKNRGNYNYRPNGPGRAAARLVGLVHMVFGIFFALMGLSALPTVGLFGLPFILAGGFFAWNGWRVATLKEPGMKTVKGEEREFVFGLKFHAPVSPTAGRGARPAGERTDRPLHRRDARPEEELHDHIRPMGDTRESRLEQLRSLREAGLYTDEEYRQERERILK